MAMEVKRGEERGGKMGKSGNGMYIGEKRGGEERRNGQGV
jgi:hypothetical protein